MNFMIISTLSSKEHNHFLISFILKVLKKVLLFSVKFYNYF